MTTTITLASLIAQESKRWATSTAAEVADMILASLHVEGDARSILNPAVADKVTVYRREQSRTLERGVLHEAQATATAARYTPPQREPGSTHVPQPTPAARAAEVAKLEEAMNSETAKAKVRATEKVRLLLNRHIAIPGGEQKLYRDVTVADLQLKITESEQSIDGHFKSIDAWREYISLMQEHGATTLGEVYGY